MCGAPGAPLQCVPLQLHHSECFAACSCQALPRSRAHVETCIPWYTRTCNARTHTHAHTPLAPTQVHYSGRQVGGKFMPGSHKAQEKSKTGGAQLMPTERELLEDAQVGGAGLALVVVATACHCCGC